LGQDSSLNAGPGYDLATGVGSPSTDYLTHVGSADSVSFVQRLSGPDRFATGIQISQKAFPNNGSAPAVVLATGESFPDALSGVPLAKKLGAPLLLTPSAGPDPRVTAEIHRVLAGGGKVYVLGGQKAVSDNVIRALGLPAARIQRIGGVDRFDTSLLIAKAMGNPTKVVVATGVNFADALAAGPYAANVFGGATPGAVLLSNDATLTPAIRQYLTGATGVAAVGGQAVTAVNNAHIPHIVATFKGFDRFDTASKVAATFQGEHVAGLATGLQFADALTGAAFLANNGGPLVLTNPTNLPNYTATALKGIGAALASNEGTLEVLGGPVAVSDATELAAGGITGGRVVAV
jgi:hypothetical protein